VPSATPAKRELVAAVIQGLRELYPDADCELNFTTPLELLVATILSAQCTDERVNMVTAELFKKYRSAEDYASADPATLEQEIHSTGFFRQKAKSIRTMAGMLVDEFGGEVPRTIEEMTRLPGVARKTANVVLGNAYGIPSGIPVDTHVQRLAYRIGLSDETKPDNIERDITSLIPQDQWVWFGHALIWLGRRICHARAPQCEICILNQVCPKRGVGGPPRPKRPARMKKP
jgi:endonuclease-3